MKTKDILLPICVSFLIALILTIPACKEPQEPPAPDSTAVIPDSVLTRIDSLADSLGADNPTLWAERQKRDYLLLMEFEDDTIPPEVIQQTRQRLIREIADNWTGRWDVFRRQMDDYRYIIQTTPEDVPPEQIERIRNQAKREAPGDYSAQREIFESGISNYLLMKGV